MPEDAEKPQVTGKKSGMDFLEAMRKLPYTKAVLTTREKDEDGKVSSCSYSLPAGVAHEQTKAKGSHSLAQNITDEVDLALGGEAVEGSKRHVGFETPSGRHFRYELSEFPISSTITPIGAETLARRIFREKYVYCEWDRNHPAVDVEREMIDKIVRFILSRAQDIRRADERRPQKYAFWGVFCNARLVEKFPFIARADADRRLAELLVEHPGQCYINKIDRAGRPPAEPETNAAPDPAT